MFKMTPHPHMNLHTKVQGTDLINQEKKKKKNTNNNNNNNSDNSIFHNYMRLFTVMGGCYFRLNLSHFLKYLDDLLLLDQYH